MIAGLLLGLVAVGPEAPDGATGHQTVYLNWDAETRSCNARVDGNQVGDPTTDDGEAALVHALPDTRRAVQLQEQGRVPYACVDSVLSALRKSGHAIKVGLHVGAGAALTLPG